MLRTLRGRFILSHVLPLLVIIPLMGLALVYVLETQVLLPNIANELMGDADLITEITKDHPQVWTSQTQAKSLLTRLGSHLDARVMLIDAGGHLLASTESTGTTPPALDQADLTKSLSGQVTLHTEYSQRLGAEVADVWVPVMGANNQVVGIIRLTHRLSGVYQEFTHLRYLIAGVVLTGLLLGTVVGLVLALNLERPLKQVTEAVYQLATGTRLTRLPEQGPQETRMLLHAVNTVAERLRSAEEARRRLLANLVHELGRPLGALNSATQALLNGADADKSLRRELLEGMVAETQQLQRLLDDLAQLHDQALGILELDRQPIDLSEWLPPLLAPWREAARDKDLHWQTTLPADLPTVEADSDRLAQAVGNLVSNAVKYTPPEGTVSVAAGAEDNAVWIRVSDTGPGISPEEQEQIFTPFYRGTANRRFQQGMGLGLSIVRDLVDAHGGRLDVDSTLGEGSSFTLWLPLDGQAEPAAAAKTSAGQLAVGVVQSRRSKPA